MWPDDLGAPEVEVGRCQGRDISRHTSQADKGPHPPPPPQKSGYRFS